MHLMQMALMSLHGLIDVASFLAVDVVPAFAGDLAAASIPISHKLLLALFLLLKLSIREKTREIRKIHIKYYYTAKSC
jgi:hypothetical protein